MVKLLILYFAILFLYNGVEYCSNVLFIKQFCIKYFYISPGLAFDFTKNILLLIVSMSIMVILSRGYLWMFGINSLKFKESLWRYLIYFIPYLYFVLLFGSNSTSQIVNYDSNVTALFYYLFKILIQPISFVIFYFGLLQSVIEKKIYPTNENIIYKLNTTILIIIIIFTYEYSRNDYPILVMTPLIILNSVTYLFTKSLLIPLIAQIIFSILLILL